MSFFIAIFITFFTITEPDIDIINKPCQDSHDRNNNTNQRLSRQMPRSLLVLKRELMGE